MLTQDNDNEHDSRMKRRIIDIIFKTADTSIFNKPKIMDQDSIFKTNGKVSKISLPNGITINASSTDEDNAFPRRFGYATFQPIMETAPGFYFPLNNSDDGISVRFENQFGTDTKYPSNNNPDEMFYGDFSSEYITNFSYDKHKITLNQFYEFYEKNFKGGRFVKSIDDILNYRNHLNKKSEVFQKFKYNKTILNGKVPKTKELLKLMSTKDFDLSKIVNKTFIRWADENLVLKSPLFNMSYIINNLYYVIFSCLNLTFYENYRDLYKCFTNSHEPPERFNSMGVNLLSWHNLIENNKSVNHNCVIKRSFGNSYYKYQNFTNVQNRVLCSYLLEDKYITNFFKENEEEKTDDLLENLFYKENSIFKKLITIDNNESYLSPLNFVSPLQIYKSNKNPSKHIDSIKNMKMDDPDLLILLDIEYERIKNQLNNIFKKYDYGYNKKSYEEIMKDDSEYKERFFINESIAMSSPLTIGIDIPIKFIESAANELKKMYDEGVIDSNYNIINIGNKLGKNEKISVEEMIFNFNVRYNIFYKNSDYYEKYIYTYILMIDFSYIGLLIKNIRPILEKIKISDEFRNSGTTLESIDSIITNRIINYTFINLQKQVLNNEFELACFCVYINFLIYGTAYFKHGLNITSLPVCDFLTGDMYHLVKEIFDKKYNITLPNIKPKNNSIDNKFEKFFNDEFGLNIKNEFD